MSYGTAAGVAALVPRFLSAAGVFDTTTTPAAADVTTWLGQVSAMLDVALSGYGVPTPVTDATVVSMLDAYANAQVAAVARGVNGQGKYAEKSMTADEILLLIGADAARWLAAWMGGIGNLLDVTPGTTLATVDIGRFERIDGYTGAATEYATEDTL